jgi:hypothetical protein
LKRPLDADEESSVIKKKVKRNTSKESEPEDGLVVSMVSARIQLTFTANSLFPCDSCVKSNKECTGRGLHTACDSCQISRKACKVGDVSIRASRAPRAPRVPKQAANSGVVFEEEFSAVAVQARKLTALAKSNLELVGNVQQLQEMAVGLYDAAFNDADVLPVLTRFMDAYEQDNHREARDGGESNE